MRAHAMLRLSLGVTAVLAAVVVLDAAHHRVDHAAETEYHRELRQLKAAEAELGAHLLASRSGQVQHYDGLVLSLSELYRVHGALDGTPAFLDEESKHQLKLGVAESRALLVQADQEIERYKTQFAVLRNSLHYFPIAAEQAAKELVVREDPDGRELFSDVSSLMRAVLLLNVTPETDSLGGLVEALTSVERRQESGAGGGPSPELDGLIHHAHIIAEREPLVNRLVRKALAVPLSSRARLLEETYGTAYRAALDRQSASEEGAFALLLLLVALVSTDVILRIQASRAVLERTTEELKSANRALAREREKEREVGELKTRFVAMTSHEFRTPLSMILSSSELLDAYGERWEPERKGRHLSQIRGAAQRMSRMLDEILLIGRAEAGVLRATPSPIDLREFCRDLVETLSTALGAEGRIVYQYQGDSDVVLDGDLLTRVLSNLVENALKYSAPETKVTLSVSTSERTSTFSVRDRGMGIPKQDLPNLFFSFHRGENVGHVRGSGLGLAVVRRALDVQGGSIEVESRVGGGSAFLVILPRRLGDDGPSGGEGSLS